jgi:hypothetical protein
MIVGRRSVLTIAAVLIVGILGNLSTPLLDWASSKSVSSAVEVRTDQRLQKLNKSNVNFIDGNPHHHAGNSSRRSRAKIRGPLSSDANTTYCARWEENTDTWWTHHPMWDISKENSTHTCFYYDRTYTYQKKIYLNQFQTKCENNTETRYMWSSGWAADFGNVVFPLMQNMDRGRPYALFNPSSCWHYAADKNDCSQPTCPSKDMSCYFLNFTACPHVEPEVVSQWDIVTTEKHDRMTSRVYFYVIRQRQWVRQAVYNEVQKHVDHIPFGTCAVMHVRRGDVVLHDEYARKYFPISDYMDLLPKSRKQDIFLLTDDANAISEAKEFYPNTTWYYFDRKRHKGAEGGWESQIPSKDPKQEVLTILATFQLVQRCDTFVHSDSGFAKDIGMHMRKSKHKKALNILRVDENIKEILSIKHNNSHAELAKLLNERRRQGSTIKSKRFRP